MISGQVLWGRMLSLAGKGYDGDDDVGMMGMYLGIVQCGARMIPVHTYTCTRVHIQYEPYVLALKSSLPRWDERFRGYVCRCATRVWCFVVCNVTHPTPHAVLQ